jgi:hypothetical protein
MDETFAAHMKVIKERAAIAEQREADARDAARYREVRKMRPVLPQHSALNPTRQWEPGDLDALCDAAIDEAMRAP